MAAPSRLVRGGRERIHSPILCDLQETSRSDPPVPGTLRVDGAGTREARHKTVRGGRRARELVSAGPRPFPRGRGPVSCTPGSRDEPGPFRGPPGRDEEDPLPAGNGPTVGTRASEAPPSGTELTFPQELHAARRRGRAHPGAQLPLKAPPNRKWFIAPPPPASSTAFPPITGKTAVDALLLRAAIGPRDARPGLAGKRHVPGSAPSCVDRIPAQLGSPILCAR